MGLRLGDPGWLTLREEALRIVDGRGLILETAREISKALAVAVPSSAIIDGVAVVLHGHVRTTVDVDVFVDAPLGSLIPVLESIGFLFDPAKREFRRDHIPVHLVTIEQLEVAPKAVVEIEGIRTVSLADLIAMKLRSGSKNLLRAQDLADVIGLVRGRKLTSSFASQLPKELRPEYRQIVRAIASQLD
jgi:hypothetical protein